MDDAEPKKGMANKKLKFHVDQLYIRNTEVCVLIANC